MSDHMRFLRADSKEMYWVPVASATVIEIGDLVWLNGSNVEPATTIAHATSATQTKQDFADAFAGVAMEASADGQTYKVGVATEGVFLFDCAAATFDVWDLISIVATGTTAVADAQTVVGGAAAAEAIGVAARYYSANTTSVEVEIEVELARFSLYA